MNLRILVFDDENIIRAPIRIFLKDHGYEVLDFASPVSCALISENQCPCPRDHACADIVITDMNMPGMSGLELVRKMADNGCHVPPENKIVISSALTLKQEAELHALGCHYLPKPFELDALLTLILNCRQNVLHERKLVPREELLRSTAGQAGGIAAKAS